MNGWPNCALSHIIPWKSLDWFGTTADFLAVAQFHKFTLTPWFAKRAGHLLASTAISVFSYPQTVWRTATHCLEANFLDYKAKSFSPMNVFSPPPSFSLFSFIFIQAPPHTTLAKNALILTYALSVPRTSIKGYINL